MKIYTKQGDGGQTQVYSKEILRLDKDDLLLESYGTLDELNSHIGLIHAMLRELNAQFANQQARHEVVFQQQLDLLIDIQKTLFDIGFALSDQDRLDSEVVIKLEQHIDNLTNTLPPQTKFILPGGSVLSAHIHIARTVTRRSERVLVALAKAYETNPLAQTYLNRLSDYLFTLARWSNQIQQHPDTEI